MPNDEIMERIKSLMAKAIDPAATPAEADAAMQMAQKLMAKYSLTQDDLKHHETLEYRETVNYGTKTKKGKWAYHPVDRYCAVIVGKFCGVLPYYKTNGVQKGIAYYGLDADVELATWIIHAFKQQFDRDWIVYKNAQMRTRRLVDLVEARLTFSQAFGDAVTEKLQDWLYRQSPDQGTSDGKSLVLQKQDLARRHLEETTGMKLGSRGSHTRTGTDSHAAGAGYNAGKSAAVGRGMAGAAGGRILLG